MSLLDDQVAIVTGAGQGLGRAIALELASEGAQVAVLDIIGEAAEAVRDEIAKSGGRARAYAIDITDDKAYETVVGDVVSWQDRIDILVNNAGIARYGTILNDNLGDWQRTIAVNLDAVITGSRLVTPAMVARRYGRIINIASIAGFASRGNVGSYNASKGALISATRSLAVALAPHDIFVNAVAPGFLRTPMVVLDGVDETATPDFSHWYYEHGKIPLRRAGTPEDVAGAIVFLASSYCRYMTGQCLVIDGGRTITF